jgi:hypothetical protein
MVKKVYGKSDWQEFRKEILELVILYHHVKEFSEFDKDKIEYIKSFFYLSKKQAITAFFIKVGFLITQGTPTLKNFLGKEDYDELMKIYTSKVGLVRDKLYAHNAKTDKKMTNFSLSNNDMEDMYGKIISSAQDIDKKFEDTCIYSFVYNSDGIKSIESLIANCIELRNLKSELRKHNYKALVELGIMDGKINILNTNVGFTKVK